MARTQPKGLRAGVSPDNPPACRPPRAREDLPLLTPLFCRYCFDYIAAFIWIQSYVTITGDTQLLLDEITNNHDQQGRRSACVCAHLSRLTNSLNRFFRS